MRVPVLITITFASATTALVESVIRPVSDAFVDCARSGVTEDKSIPVRTRIARRATGQGDLAMLKGKTKSKIIVSIPARLDRVHTYPAVICILGLSRRQRENLRITGDVPFDRSTCRLALIMHWVGIPGNDGDWTAQATPLRGAPGLRSQPNREP